MPSSHTSLAPFQAASVVAWSELDGALLLMKGWNGIPADELRVFRICRVVKGKSLSGCLVVGALMVFFEVILMVLLA